MCSSDLHRFSSVVLGGCIFNSPKQRLEERKEQIGIRMLIRILIDQTDEFVRQPENVVLVSDLVLNFQQKALHGSFDKRIAQL